jgi:hypothetical protein
LTSADQLQLSSLDDAMANLVNFDAMLSADKNNAADADIYPQIQKAQEKYTSDIAIINALEVAQSTKDGFLSDYNSNVKTTLTAAVDKRTASLAQSTQFADHDAIKALLTNYYSVRTGVDNLSNNKKQEANVTALYSGLDKSLNLAIDTISRYYIAEQFQTEILALTKELKDQETTANQSYLMTGIAPVTEANTFKTNFMVKVNDIVDRATTTEFTHLKGDINVLNAEFLKLDDATRLANAKLKQEITDVTDSLGKVVLAAKNAPDALVGLEARVSTVRTTLATINPAPTDAAILGDLNKQLADLATKAALADYSTYVKAQVNDEAITVTGDITTEQQYVAKVSGSIVYYKEKVQNKIDLITAEVNTLIANAENAKKVQVASDALAAEIQAKIDAFAQSESNAKAHIDANTFWKSSKYTDDWADIEGQISTMNQELATKKANVELTSNTIDDAQLATSRTKLNGILDDAAYNEINASVNNLSTNVQKTMAVFYSRTYSTAKWNEFNGKISSITAEIANKFPTPVNQRPNWTDANLTSKMKTIADIQKEIDDLRTSLDTNQLGDINNDGNVSAADFNTLIDYVIGNKTMPDASSAAFAVLDINGDGILNVSDAVKLVNLTMNPAKDPLTSPASAYLPNVTESLSMQTVSESNNVTRVAVNLKNAKAYVAYQMDVKLPSNMKLVGQSLTSRADNHEIFTGVVDGSTRIVAASIANNAFTGSEGAILYLDIETVGNFDSNQIEFSNIIFATRDAQQTEMTLGGQTTGINSVEGTAESLKAKIYNVGGKLMNQIKKGINIIRNSDGSTQKVIKK